MDRSFIQNWIDKGKHTVNDRITKKIDKLLEEHKPVALGDHELSELERVRKEGEKVLKESAH